MMVQALLLLPRLVVTPESSELRVYSSKKTANQLNWPYKRWLPSYVASKQRAGCPRLSWWCPAPGCRSQDLDRPIWIGSLTGSCGAPTGLVGLLL
jgi:hypothetical protein